ncbi:MAG: glycerol-3-phosphate acyltransferase [Asgard group archaeon]|nr:glycerol-3-phosphate acyltransferase [Asgard group archaeon]
MNQYLLGVLLGLSALIIGYLLGSIPFAWIIVKLVTGQDVRTTGSGSVSTRNTIRTAGYGWALITASLDVSKGFLAAFLTKFFIFPAQVFPSFPEFTTLMAALAGVGAFAGHLWMPWMKFTGGKGFAVFSGALLVLNPWGILVWWLSIPLWLIIIRYSYLAGISATASVAILNTIFYVTDATFWSEWPILVHGWACVVIIILKMIPDFKKMRTGEIKRWQGIKVSQWMK